jgi:hypothetical protein
MRRPQARAVIRALVSEARTAGQAPPEAGALARRLGAAKARLLEELRGGEEVLAVGAGLEEVAGALRARL